MRILVILAAATLLLSPAIAQERPGLANLSEFAGRYVGVIDTGANSPSLGEVEITVTADRVSWRVALDDRKLAHSQRADEFESLPFGDLMWQLREGDVARTRPYGFREHNGALYILKTKPAADEAALYVRGWLFGGMRRIALFSSEQVARGVHDAQIAELEKDGVQVKRLQPAITVPGVASQK